jgi:hypothetical protein
MIFIIICNRVAFCRWFLWPVEKYVIACSNLFMKTYLKGTERLFRSRKNDFAQSNPAQQARAESGRDIHENHQPISE